MDKNQKLRKKILKSLSGIVIKNQKALILVLRPKMYDVKKQHDIIKGLKKII